MTDIKLDALEAAAHRAFDAAEYEGSWQAECAYLRATRPSVILALIAELRKLKQHCAQLTKERMYLAKCLEYNNGPDTRISAYEYIARAKEVTSCQK